MNLNPFNREPKSDSEPGFMYTEQQLMARLKFFIGICLAVTLVGIVFVVLYSIIFVTQPLNAMSPIDAKFFELIIPIATFLTGTLSGIMLGSTPREEPVPEPEYQPPQEYQEAEPCSNSDCPRR